MFDDQDLPDSMKKFFDEMKIDFGTNDFPMTDLQYSSLRKFLELQTQMMKRYQKLLNDQLSTDPMGDAMSQMTKNFMSMYLDFARFSREHRKKVLEIQCEMMQKNLDMFEGFLNRFDNNEK